MARKKPARAGKKKTAAPPPERPDSPAPRGLSFGVAGIGASAGGIEAASALLRALPPDTGLAFVLIHHLGRTHESMLTEILARATAMPVRGVVRPTAVEPNHVYVISPAFDLVMSGGSLIPQPRAESRGQHHPIDLFLRTLAEDQGHKAIGVILSGSATDGTLGCEEIKAAGGVTFAQDDSAEHQSMPRSAAAAGCVDFVLPPAAIAGELARIAKDPYVAPEDEERAAVLPRLDILPMLDLLQESQGVDFSHYKRNTLFRRIARRMLLHKMKGAEEYVAYLRQNLGEREALYQDILINVTTFFRNPEAYEALKSEVFPRLTEGRARHDPLRVWVLGCSTGEEAYSLAIVLSEYLEANARQIPMQIFATDVNGAGIERARAGSYARHVVQDVSPERLRRYFVEIDGMVAVRKSIRDACVFARHNVLTEPPFSRIDLVSCRNMLIYLGQETQQRVIPMLHYALQPGGFLWLGSSETIGSYRDLFEPESSQYKFYRKRPPGGRYDLGPIVQGLRREAPGPRPATARMREPPAPGTHLQKEADRLLLARYAPASVLVDADYDILQFRGDTGPFLALAPGYASLNLFKMLREGLLVAVRAALNEARKAEAPARREGLSIKTNGGYEDVNVEVVPVRAEPAAAACYLVLFERAADGKTAARAKKRKAPPVERPRSDGPARRAQQELDATREYLQSVIEQQEAANEELQSANEEVQSANEELQSINEELQTSKEEITSTNEELGTVNEELNHRNLEMSQVNGDLINILSSVQMAIVIVGQDLRIRRFTPLAERMLNLIPADVGRPIMNLNPNRNLNLPATFERHLEEVMENVSPQDLEILDKAGRWYSLRLRPYRTLENKIDGVVIIMVDVDTLKRGQELLQRQADLLDEVNQPILMWELRGKVVYCNKSAEALYGFTRDRALASARHELLTSAPFEDIEAALKRDGHWSGEISHTREDGGRIALASRMVLAKTVDGRDVVIEANRPLAGAAAVTGDR